MTKKISHCIQAYLVFLMLWNVFFAYADHVEGGVDGHKTIQQLRENIQDLHETKQDIDVQVQELKKSSDLGEFFKDSLSKQDIDTLEGIIYEYRVLNTQINTELIQIAQDGGSTLPIKQQLLEERKNLYKRLVPYIKIEKLDDYKNYIAGDAEYLLEKKEVSEDIIRKEGIIEQKVEKIEQKIEAHQKDIEQTLRETIHTRLDTYLVKMSENEKFGALDYQGKVAVVEGLQDKLRAKITTLRSNPRSTTTMIQKIDILEEIFDKKLEIFKNNLEK